MTKYRVAHLVIKAWAKSRGLYAAKFGLLGGIHITSMLVPVCKALANEPEAASTADVLTSFFHHYSTFDWATGVVYDPFYHTELRYHRTFREPLCLLGWHGPSLNTASSASISTVNALASEFTRAATLLSQEGMTWSKFLGVEQSESPSSLLEKGAADFLDSYRTYIKISARYWGSSQQKGRKYLGWLESRLISILVGKYLKQLPTSKRHILTLITRHKPKVSRHCTTHLACPIHRRRTVIQQHRRRKSGAYCVLLDRPQKGRRRCQQIRDESDHRRGRHPRHPPGV